MKMRENFNLKKQSKTDFEKITGEFEKLVKSSNLKNFRKVAMKINLHPDHKDAFSVDTLELNIHYLFRKLEEAIFHPFTTVNDFSLDDICFPRLSYQIQNVDSTIDHSIIVFAYLPSEFLPIFEYELNRELNQITFNETHQYFNYISLKHEFFSIPTFIFIKNNIGFGKDVLTNTSVDFKSSHRPILSFSYSNPKQSKNSKNFKIHSLLNELIVSAFKGLTPFEIGTFSFRIWTHFNKSIKAA